jgi:hypothetical protein
LLLAYSSYGGIRSKHPTLAARAALDAARRISTATQRPMNDEDEEDEAEPSLGFAQKFLLGGYSSFSTVAYTKPTKKIRSTSMIFGCLPLSLKTTQFSKTKKKRMIRLRIYPKLRHILW